MTANVLMSLSIEDIISGLIPTLFIALLTIIFKIAHNIKINKKFPIHGKYISKFEDVIDGKKITAIAPAIFTQKGKRLKISTWLESDEKHWNMNAQIIKGGYITGVYNAENPHDAGKGVFFLKIKKDLSLHGFWCGYDSENLMITSGKYSFYKPCENYTTSIACKADKMSIVSIADKELGRNYVSEDLVKAIDNQQNSVLVLSKDACVLGFSFFWKFAKPDIIQHITISPEILSKPMLKCAENIGFIKSVAVDEAAKRKGAGYALIENSIEQLKDVDIILTLVWKSNEGANALSLIERFKFTMLCELENYWYQDSLEQNFNCPVCGNPCTCSALLYYYIPIQPKRTQ